MNFDDPLFAVLHTTTDADGHERIQYVSYHNTIELALAERAASPTFPRVVRIVPVVPQGDIGQIDIRHLHTHRWE